MCVLATYTDETDKRLTMTYNKGYVINNNITSYLDRWDWSVGSVQS